MMYRSLLSLTLIASASSYTLNGAACHGATTASIFSLVSCHPKVTDFAEESGKACNE